MFRKSGFTYIELLITVLVLTIVALIAMPEGNTAATLKAEIPSRRAATRFKADVDYARSYSIARADDPAVIVIDRLKNRYWLGTKKNKGEPIQHPLGGFRYHQPPHDAYQDKYVVQFGPGGLRGTESVTIVGVDAGADDVILFDSAGGIVKNSEATLQLASQGGEAEVKITPTTGATRILNKFTGPLAESVGTSINLSVSDPLEPADPMLNEPDILLN